MSKDGYEYFNSNLKSSLTYTDIVATFGNPDGDLGSSGIHAYYYSLEDGTSMWIGYTDKIMYPNTAQLLNTII